MTLVFCLAACQCTAQDNVLRDAANRRRETAKQNELADLRTFLYGQGISMTKPGIQKYLRGLADSSRDVADIEKLIRQLGSSRFGEREAAQQALMKLRRIPIELLQEAAEDADRERSQRAKTILGNAIPQQRQTVRNAFRAVELLELAGLREEVFEAAQLVQDERILASLEPVLLATVVAEDFPWLQSLIDDNPADRTMAIHALAAERLANVEGVREQLDSLWNNGTAADRLASTESLLARGNRDALDRFVILLESPEVADRYRAALRLRRATGQRFPFDANASPERRAEQAAIWTAWIDESGANAELQIGILFKRRWDRTLVAIDVVGSNDQDGVVEYDLEGNQTWRVPLDNPNVCWATENGERVVGSNNETIVYAAGDGPPRVLWRLAKRVHGHPRLTGEMLVWHGNSVGEYDLSGQTVWETKVAWKAKPTAPLLVAPLPNGNIRVDIRVSQKGGAVVPDTAIEIDSSGKLVRQIPNDKIRILQVLPNGNTLVRPDPDGGRRGITVEERDPSGSFVWSYTTVRGALLSAQRLANGNTLVCEGGNGPKELQPDGTITWELKVKGALAAYRY